MWDCIAGIAARGGPGVAQPCPATAENRFPKMGWLSATRSVQQSDVKPHKVRYYLERRDEEFETKMADVLYPSGEDRGPLQSCDALLFPALALHDGRIGLMDFDEFFKVFDSKAGKACRALVVDAIDGQASVFRVHFKRDIGQPVLILAQHRGHTGDREDSAWGRHDQAASRRSRDCQDHGSSSSNFWTG